MSNIGEIFKLFGTIGLKTDEAEQGLDNITGKAKKTGKGLVGAFTDAVKGAGKLAASLGLVMLAKKGFDMIRDSIGRAFKRIDVMEQFTRVMTVMTGSAEKANEILDKTSDIVTGTAYGLDVAALSVQNFVTSNMEVDKATDTVAAWGDAVAFYGDGSNETFASVTDALAKMSGKGKVSLQEINRLTEAGIPALQIYADKTGKSVEQVSKEISAGKISAEEFTDTMNDALMNGTDKFGAIEGAAKEAGASWGASFDNMRAAVARGTVSIIQSIDEMLVNNGLPDMREMVSNFGKAFENALKKVAEYIPIVIGKIIEFKDAIVGSALFQMLQDGFQQVMDKIREFKDNFGSLKDQLMNNEIWELFKGYLQALVDYWTGLFSGEGNLGETFARIFNMVKDVALPILQDAVEFIKDILSQVVAFWNENGDQIVQAVKNAFGLVASIIKLIMPLVEAIIVTVWGNIKGVIQGALNIILGLVKIFAGVFTGDWSKVWEGVKQLFKGAIEFVWNLWNLIMMKNMLSGIKNFVANGIAGIKSFFTGIVSSAKSGLSTFTGSWEGAISVVKSIISGFKNTAVGIFNALKGSVTSIFNGIKTAIQNPIKTAVNAVKGLIDKMKGFFNFSWSLPKLKLPKVSIKGKFSLAPPSVPSFGIDWFAKGGILTKAMAFGMNGNDVMVGGEAGKEAVLPLNKETLGGIGTGIASTMDFSQKALLEEIQMLRSVVSEYLPIAAEQKTMVMNNGALVGSMLPEVNRQLGNSIDLRGRGR